MYMFASDLFSMSFTKRRRLILFGKSSYLGCAKFNIRRRNRRSTVEVVVYVCRLHHALTISSSVLSSTMAKATHDLALRHSTLFSGLIRAQDPSSRDSSSPSLKPIPFSVPSSPAHPEIGDDPLASLRIGLVMHDGGFAGRVNNVTTLFEVNRQVCLVVKLICGRNLIASQVPRQNKLCTTYGPGEPGSH
jgi:hypothetical protein